MENTPAPNEVRTGDQRNPAAGERRFLGVLLSSDTAVRHMLFFYLACYAAIMLASFVPQTQPFLLAEVLRLDASRQGVVSGNLNFAGEIVIIVTVGLWGSLSDRVGRRRITAAGFLLAAAGLLLYGASQSISGLLLARVVYAAGIAAVSTMLITLMADYVRDSSRGKATGLLGVMNGLGAMTAALFLLQLPSAFMSAGMDAESAAQATYGTMTAVAVLIGVAMYAGLRKDAAAARERRAPLLRRLAEGFAEARREVIALAYAASFLARGNLAVVGTFFTLWASVYGTAELGLTAAEAIARGGGVLAVSYAASLLSAPLFGLLSDRVNRVSALACALLVSAAGYGGALFLENPFSPATVVCLVIIGMAEVGCIITSGVLIAERAPDRIRGSVIGVFTLSGAVGILIASLIGGYLFDHWRMTGPFAFFGLIAALIFVWALSFRLRSPDATPRSA